MKSVQLTSFFWSVFSCFGTEYGDLRSKSAEYNGKKKKNCPGEKDNNYADFKEGSNKFLACCYEMTEVSSSSYELNKNFSKLFLVFDSRI